jgi:hypothetical protein
MLKAWLLVMLLAISCWAYSQGFEISPLQDSYKGAIGETIKVPLRLKNTSDKAITLTVRKVGEQIGSTQKNYLCVDSSCADQKAEDHIVKVEPGQTLSNLFAALEGGLVPGVSSVKYVVFNRLNPTQLLEFDVNFAVEEKSEKAPNIYSSRHITLYDVYPNPATDYANVAYKLDDDQIKAKILLHNILGNVIGEYSLPSAESAVRIKTDDLSSGIYFYTLYLDNEGVTTRKLIVKR